MGHVSVVLRLFFGMRSRSTVVSH